MTDKPQPLMMHVITGPNGEMVGAAAAPPPPAPPTSSPNYRIRIQDSGDPNYINRILIGTPSTGLVRMEWVQARYGQIIPVNWSNVQMVEWMDGFVPIRYQVDDAQNMIVRTAIQGNFEWCFRGDTIIETIDGGKKITEVQVNDLVKTHLGRYRRVLKTMRREFNQRHPTIWIKTPHSTIKCTEGHPFLTRQGWKRADELGYDDRLLYPCANADDRLNFDITCSTNGSGYHGNAGSVHDGKTIGEIEVTRDLARFMGLYLAEGHAERDAVCWTFNNNEKELHDFVTGICLDVFDRKPTIRSSWSTQVRLNIRNLAPRFREWFGSNAREKRVPAFVHDWNLLNRLEFLRGYLDGDGSYRPDGCPYASASLELIQGIDRLARACGLEPAPQYAMAPTVSHFGEHEISNSGSFTSRIPKKSLDKMFDLLNAALSEEYLELRIEGIELHPLAANLIDSAVYNLEVEEDNSYIADCAAVHNCLFIEHDTCPPPDALIRLNAYMREEKVPVVSGLYYTRTRPSEPLVFRGRGNSVYTDWQMGDLVWCDGVPTGMLLVHMSILRAMWDESPEYAVRGQITRRVFDTPRAQWYDPQYHQYNSVSGTSDLNWCDRVIKGKYLEKAGWPEYAAKEFPFLVDTGIFCTHIDQEGIKYP